MTDISYEFNGIKKPLFLDFIYNVEDEAYIDQEDNLLYYQIPTSVQCRLYDNRERVDLLIIAESHCNPLDAFDKRIGRKLAFGRAVQGLFDNHAERAAVWAAFMTKVKV